MDKNKKIEEQPARKSPVEFPNEPRKDVPNEVPKIEEPEIPEENQ